MSRYKVIPLPFYCSNPEFFDEYFPDAWESINPIFNRDGMYLDRKSNMCWVESRYGCWKAPTGSIFEDELNYISSDEGILPKRIVEAINTLENYGMLPKILKSALYKHRNAVMLKNTHLSSKKILLRIKNDKREW